MKLFLTILFSESVAELIPYRRQLFIPLHPESLAVPKWAKGDVPHWPPGHGHSYIDFSKLDLRVSCSAATRKAKSCKNATFEILMFEEPGDKFWVEYWPLSKFCCTPDLHRLGQCAVEGSLIVPNVLPSAYLRKITIPGDSAIVSLPDDGSINHHEISQTGTFIVLMGVCDALAPLVVADGSIDSIDPYGYLPADLFGNLPFYGALSCIYSLVGIIWLIVCMMYSEEVMPLQFWITAVLGLGILETCVLFAHYLSWNDTGMATTAVAGIGLLLGAFKRAVSRVVVLFVALGYGIVRPSLGEDLYKVLLLGTAYFVLSLAYSLSTAFPSNSRAVGGNQYDLMSVVVLLLSGVDTAFYIWIISSINNLLVTLAARKQVVKYILYRNFRAVLFVSIFFSFTWIIYGGAISLNNGFGVNNNWRYKWTVDALWEVTYFTIVVAIAVMWAPSLNTQRFAYSVLDTNDSDVIDGAGAAAQNDIYAQMADEVKMGMQILTVTGLAEGHPPGSEGSGERKNIDAEYGGALDDGKDPFLGSASGALDPQMAIQKKQ